MARGRGEGSIFHDATLNLWVGSVELPSHDGKRRRKIFRSKDKATVIRKMDEVKQQLRRSGDIPTASMTVEQWLEYWMREIAEKTRRPKTVASYRSVLERWVVPAIGKTRLDKVTPATIRKVLTAMDAAGLSSTYQRNTHSIMSAAFKDAEREGRMSRNPVELVIAPRKAVTDLEALTAPEAIKLLDAFLHTEDTAMWATFLLTGARRGEVLGLTWDRVTDALDLSWQLQRLPYGQPLPSGFEHHNLEGGLYLTRPKTRAGWRVVPLVDPLKAILERWRALAPVNADGLVFTRAGHPLDPDDTTAAWNDVRGAAGITKYVRLHDLRHTTVDLLYAAGVDEADISAIVGHSSRAMSRSYRSPASLERLRGSMLQLSASLGHSG